MFSSHALPNPLPQFGDFPSGLALGLKLRNGATAGNGSGKGAAVAEVYRSDGKAVGFQYFPGFINFWSARRAWIMASATSCCFCTTHKHLTVERTRRSTA
jgi:hypothetical protein